MRRIAVHFSDDILMAEIIDMAKAHGFHVRHVNGATVVDRVPNFIRHAEANVVPIAERARKAKR